MHTIITRAYKQTYTRIRSPPPSLRRGFLPRFDPLDSLIPLLGIRKQSLDDVDQLRCGEIDEGARIEEVGDIDQIGLEEFGNVLVFEPVGYVSDDRGGLWGMLARDASVCDWVRLYSGRICGT